MADKKEPKPAKVTVDTVEEPIHLADDTISKLVDEVSPHPDAAAKAADDVTTVSTIENVSTPHAQAEETLTSEGQRNVNMIWEHTQMTIALSVVGTVIVANMIVVIGVMYVLVTRWNELDTVSIAVLVAVLSGALTTIGTMGSLVIGFYFGRTNHQKIGGITQGR